MTVSIKKWGNSQGIILSKKLLEKVNLKVNDNVELNVSNDKIVIKKSKPRIDIYELFKDYNEKPFKAELMDFGNDVGNEVIE